MFDHQIGVNTLLISLKLFNSCVCDIVATPHALYLAPQKIRAIRLQNVSSRWSWFLYRVVTQYIMCSGRSLVYLYDQRLCLSSRMKMFITTQPHQIFSSTRYSWQCSHHVTESKVHSRWGKNNNLVSDFEDLILLKKSTICKWISTHLLIHFGLNNLKTKWLTVLFPNWVEKNI